MFPKRQFLAEFELYVMLTVVRLAPEGERRYVQSDLEEDFEPIARRDGLGRARHW